MAHIDANNNPTQYLYHNQLNPLNESLLHFQSLKKCLFNRSVLCQGLYDFISIIECIDNKWYEDINIICIIGISVAIDCMFIVLLI